MKKMVKEVVKKVAFGICAMSMAVSMVTVNVAADVIWEPEDSFYRESRENCSWNGRNYTAAGVNGEVKAYQDPKTDKVVGTILNGNSVYISFTYTDDFGNEWGCYEGFDQGSGWVPMAYLNVVYDYKSFEDDYGSTFAAEAGSVEATNMKDFFYGWAYPGVEFNYPYMAKDQNGNYDLPSYSTTFVDENGHKWGYVTYFYGNKDFWVCLDAPSAEYAELYPNGSEVSKKNATTQIWEQDGSRDEKTNSTVGEIKPQSNDKKLSMFLIGAIVVVIVVGAGVILRSVMKPAKKNKK